MARGRVTIPPAVVARALGQAKSFQHELQYLVSTGITRANIAHELGVSRRELYEWERGRYEPQVPALVFLVIAWAEHVRHMAGYERLMQRARADAQERSQR